MRRATALTFCLALFATACGDDSSVTTTAAPATTAATTTTEAPTTTAEPTTTTEETTTTTFAPGRGLEIHVVDFSNQRVHLRNFGTEPVDLTGYWMCQRPTYTELPSLTLGPGEQVILTLGDSDPPGELPEGTYTAAVGAIGGLSAGSGEVALYRVRDFGNPEAIVSYVEWGTPDHGRSSVAVAAGIWPAGAFIGTTPESSGIVTIGPGDNPDNWTVE